MSDMSKYSKWAYNRQGSNIPYDENLSDDEATVFLDEGKVVFAVRGSVSGQDWYETNVMLAFGAIRTSPRYRRMKQRFLKAYEQYGPLYLTGHSMGGSIVFHLLFEYPYYVVQCDTYNLGFSIEELRQSVFNTFGCKLFDRNCGVLDKLTLHRTSLDLVSILSAPFSENVLTHSIDRFTGGSIQDVEGLTREVVDGLIKKYAPIHIFLTRVG